MISKELQNARDFERMHGSTIPKTERPAFHVTGQTGWINDPNGFSSFKGEYHLFFQYHPYNNTWGPMHWGHVKTKDFITWEHLPVALAPDTEYDRFGCYSGSAIEMPDGKHFLMYTGVSRVFDDESTSDNSTDSDNYKEFQTQCIAIGDGINYTKIDTNPVITAKDIPEGFNTTHFRDPKIWYDDTEQMYYCVLANRDGDDDGIVLLFSSKDAFDWTYIKVLERSGRQFGFMLECPDFFLLDGKHVLLVSPEEVPQIGTEFPPGRATMCIIGHYDKKNHQFERETFHSIDYGLDFYAPQTTETTDGRRIMIAWMQNWGTSKILPDGARWFGSMTIPRELRIIDNRMYQNPVRELESYRTNLTRHENVIVSEKTRLDNIRGRVIDMIVKVRPVEKADNGEDRKDRDDNDAGKSYTQFTMNLAEGDGLFTSISFFPKTGEVQLDRSNSGFNQKITSRSFFIDAQDEMNVRVVMDRFSIELFFNDGKQAATMTIHTPQQCVGISFETDGRVCVDVEKYDLLMG